MVVGDLQKLLSLQRRSVDKPADWEKESDKTQLAGGTLHIIKLQGARKLRIWLPPKYDKDAPGAIEGYPVFILNDGEDVFLDQGQTPGLNAANTIAQLINDGTIPPAIVVGIDHAGVMRSFDYTPVPPGTGEEDFRMDAKDLTGGGVDQYLDLVVNVILPWLIEHYNVSRNKALRGFGGISFGGICALCMAMRHPDAFGSVYVDSPSLWIDCGRFLRDTVKNHTGGWSQRMYIGMGSREFSGCRTGSEAEQKYDGLMLKYTAELEGYLKHQGLDEERLLWQVQDGATHTYEAWRERFPKALKFLCREWKQTEQTPIPH